MSRRATSKRRKRKDSGLKSLFFGLYMMVVVLSAFVVGGYLLWTMLVSPPEIATTETVAPSITVNTEEGEVQLSTEREDGLPDLERKENYYTFLLVGCDDGNGNADTIMVVSYDLDAGKVNLVSVPRDTMVDRDWTSFPKLNSAFGYGGMELLSYEVSDMLGIPIDYYVKIELTAFQAVVDQLGGLDFYVPEDMYHDDEAGFIIDLQEGYQHLDGYQTLQLVRYRGYVNADIGRTEVQQQVLKALALQAISWNSVTSINSFVTIFNSYVDTNLSLTDMLYFAQSALTVDMTSGIYTQTLEGRGDAVKNGTSWCYELDADSVLAVVNDCLNPYTTDLDERYLNIAVADSYLS